MILHTWVLTTGQLHFHCVVYTELNETRRQTKLTHLIHKCYNIYTSTALDNCGISLVLCIKFNTYYATHTPAPMLLPRIADRGNGATRAGVCVA